MAKQKMVAPKMVAKKDNTNVARKRVNVLVADKPDYRHMYQRDWDKKKDVVRTKKDTLDYNRGFINQVVKDQIAGKPTKGLSNNLHTIYDNSYNRGIDEAADRRNYKNLKKGSMVRDSSIPLAPTEFPD
jgi:hypothetical protein